jgi:protein arginine kinase activator
MKCDQCDQEATVHELKVVAGKRMERHLCERCARKQGIAVQPQAVPVAELLEKMIQQQVSTPAKPAAPPARSTVCPACATTYAEFRQTGLLGCPECYRAFESQLGPLLERAHEGGTAHAGRVPRRAMSGSPRVSPPAEIAHAARAQAQAASPEARATRLALLRNQLETAVRAEQYEVAARLRDEIRRLSEPEGKPQQR